MTTALGAVQGRTERLERFQRDRDTLLEEYSSLVPEELMRLPQEERHRVYKIVRLVVTLSPEGDLEMQGDLIPPSLRKSETLQAIRAYQKAGFKEIGRRRECRMMGGKLWDEVHMDCLSSEFERPVTPGKEWGFSAWLPPGGTARIEVETDEAGAAR